MENDLSVNSVSSVVSSPNFTFITPVTRHDCYVRYVKPTMHDTR